MDSLAQLHDTKFQVGLGDNFYFDGVENSDDKRFQVNFCTNLKNFYYLKYFNLIIKDTYEDVFVTDHLVNTPWFFLLGKINYIFVDEFQIFLIKFIIGNHDHYGNPDAQLEYTNKSKRW